MPVGGDHAMVTVDPGVRASAAEIAAPDPRAVVTNLELLDLVPASAHAFVTVGDDDARAYAGASRSASPRRARSSSTCARPRC